LDNDLEFLKTATNAILVGASGLRKSTIAQNIAHQAVLNGHTILFTTAGQLLGDLAALDRDSALRRRLRYYAAPSLLVIDEVGYLSYSNRHADLLFELINRRHEQKSTLVTTNKSFAEWSEAEVSPQNINKKQCIAGQNLDKNKIRQV